MLFSSSTFLLIFFPLCLILYFLPFFKKSGNNANCRYKNMILLIFSIAFYAWGERVFVFVLLLSTVVNYFIGIRIEDSKISNTLFSSKQYQFLAVLFNIFMFFVFKYLGFVLKNLAYIFGTSEFGYNIALPIGISFFTFQILSYIIDVSRGKVKAQRNICDLALYIFMFPQLIAGPIVRYADVQKEIMYRKETWQNFYKGFTRFTFGLAKKVLISDYLALIADELFLHASIESISVPAAWIGAIAYALQIYFDFSGYSDMAIGLGLIFGFHFNENFNYPYISGTITEFWRRWHISLSSWFRDYIYITLGGNRVTKSKLFINLMIVWTLTGLWHGANWSFIIWGISYGVLICLEKYFNVSKATWFTRLYTFIAVIFLWVVFRSDNLTTAYEYILNMLGFHRNANMSVLALVKESWLVLGFAVLFCFPISKNLNKILEEKLKYGSIFIKLAVCSLIWIVVLAIGGLSRYTPFIYFNF